MAESCLLSNGGTGMSGGWNPMNKAEILQKRQKLSRWIVAAFKIASDIQTSGKSVIVYVSRQIVNGTNWCIIVRNNNRLFSIKVFEPLPSEPGNDIIENLVQCA